MMHSDSTELPHAHGGPPLQAILRSQAEDFIVEEELGFEASGTGEHLLLQIRKRHTNTDWLARQIAAFAGVAPAAVSYAGLKDRHALTTQSFSLHLPGRDDPDWSALELEGVEVLQSQRHHRKLRRGALLGNRFVLTLREVQGDREAAEQRLQAIAEHGVPNYFGEQRFGRGGRNVARALAMFEGQRVDRKTRGLLISAARSELFNAVLAARVTAGNWNRILAGELCCLQGSRSWFQASDDDPDLDARLRAGDIHPSGPMWGSGELESQSAVRELELAVAAQHPALCAGLASVRLDQERRALRLLPRHLSWSWPDQSTLSVSFELQAGSYATAVLRELTLWTSPSETAP